MYSACSWSQACRTRGHAPLLYMVRAWCVLSVGVWPCLLLRLSCSRARVCKEAGNAPSNADEPISCCLVSMPLRRIPSDEIAENVDHRLGLQVHNAQKFFALCLQQLLGAHAPVAVDLLNIGQFPCRWHRANIWRTVRRKSLCALILGSLCERMQARGHAATRTRDKRGMLEHRGYMRPLNSRPVDSAKAPPDCPTTSSPAGPSPPLPN